MEVDEVKRLVQVLTRIERKLDTVIRAIYEHDEGIQDDYGRTKRFVEAGRGDGGAEEDGEVLGSNGSCKQESRGQGSHPNRNRQAKG